MSKKTTLGLIVANRGFFPDKLCEEGRGTMLKVLEDEDIHVITLSSQDTKYGSVESLQDAQKCADLFKKHRDEIDGVMVTLPNFGDEKGVANTLRFSGLDVPVLIQAFPDDAEKMTIADRGDSFCGKMSVCNNLNQYGIKYSLTKLHTVNPEDKSFRDDLLRFKQVCQVVQGLKNLRLGVIGARPAAFNTVRFSEKIFERAGISVETIDLSEVFGAANRLAKSDQLLKAKLDEIKSYITIKDIPNQAIERMARFGVVVENWMGENELQASAIQCWTSMEQYFGAVPCTLMSIMSNNLMPSACETDVGGAIAMYAMVMASGKPSAIVDWNNNYGDESDKCVIFHCSNFPKDIFVDAEHISSCRNCSKENLPTMDFQEIIAGDVGKENSYGTIVGRIKPGPFTFCRVATDDISGKITTYVGQGELTDDPLQTFGGYGVVHIPRLQDLLQYICEKGFEHHVAINLYPSALAISEAFEKYLDWDVYFHNNVFD
jgi:L-fucose isomerase-like protein